MTRWELATTGRAELGEGPVWDPSDDGYLWFVDIRGHTVHRLHPATGIDEQRDVRQPAGGAIPRTDGGLVLMLADGIHLYSWDTALPQRLLALGDDDPHLLMNDAKCDPRGRLWAESVPADFRDGASTLFRVDQRGLTPVITGCALANGMGWSPDGSRMYFVDSRRRIVEAFDYDLATGELSGRRTWITIPEAHGWADGLTVDAEGGVWVAMYLNGAVHRYDATGSLSEVIHLPARKVTSVCFGGEALTDLYVTSASFGLSPTELDAEPYAGCTFVIRDAGVGQPSVPWDRSTMAVSAPQTHRRPPAFATEPTAAPLLGQPGSRDPEQEEELDEDHRR